MCIRDSLQEARLQDLGRLEGALPARVPAKAASDRMAGLRVRAPEAPEGLASPQHVLQVRENGLLATGAPVVLR
eukprot:2067097-Alexandrium_andersonii.AAC.1